MSIEPRPSPPPGSPRHPQPYPHQHSPKHQQQHHPVTTSSRGLPQLAHPKEKERPRKFIGEWKLSETLGQGAYAKVKLAINQRTGERRACKIIHYRGGRTHDPARPYGPTVEKLPSVNHACNALFLHPSHPDQVVERRHVREAALGNLLRHKHIASVHDIVLMNNFYYLFSDLVDGQPLLSLIIQHGPLNESVARRLMLQLVSAIDYCHQNSVCHRDLKIENVLVDRRGDLKVIDFGMAALFESMPIEEAATRGLDEFCGSLYYACPEVLRGKRYVGPEVDIWSMGIILYILVCGRVPFDDPSLPSLQSKICSGHIDFPDHVTLPCRSLIVHMLTVDPRRRATMLQIKHHPWTVAVDDPAAALPLILPISPVAHRAPMTWPPDMRVVDHMVGFELGTREDIVGRLRKAYDSLPASYIFPPVDPAVSVYYLVMERYKLVPPGEGVSTPPVVVKAPPPPSVVIKAPPTPPGSTPGSTPDADADAILPDVAEEGGGEGVRMSTERSSSKGKGRHDSTLTDEGIGTMTAPGITEMDVDP
ncbi:serine/threonine-protein kinase KIN2 [Irineochytrium annulatum]|nr:serine/threonine-protein kinase KIN2 [Irineochytrium annulatum]